ncbi:MAG TPA: hypothetical protein VL084_06775 [Thermoanaerobaculia bacterium]|nr:hypothetical protein [Thermoanaerobaculia bacterium]
MDGEPLIVLPSARLSVTGDVVCLAALAVAGAGLLAGGALRRLRPAGSWGAAGAFLLASAALLAAGGRLPAAAVVAGLVLLALSLAGLASRSDPVSPAEPPRRTGRWSAFLPGATLVAVGALLLLRAGGPTEVLQAWEPSVLLGLEGEMTDSSTTAAALTRRLLWQQGLLSTGGDSLLYGFPTLLLLSNLSASLFSLRLVAALFALASLALCWAFMRRLFGGAAAAAAAVLWCLAPSFFLYGRYATSVTAMWTTLWIALGAVIALLSAPSAARAGLAAVAFYVATLEYAPGRIVVVALLGLVAVVLPIADAPKRTKGLAALVLLALTALLVGLNAREDRLETFYATRGEHLFGIRHHADAVESYFGHPVPTDLLPWSETPRLALRIVESNLPVFRAHLAPVAALPRDGEALAVDPPPLPLVLRGVVPLVLWGLVRSFRTRAGPPWLPAGLLAAFALASVPLLLTNRIDVARVGPLLPFLAVWGGLGAADLVTRLALSAGRPPAFAVALVFVLGGASDVASAINFPSAPRNEVGESLGAGLAAVDGPVRLGVHASYQEIGGAWLRAIDRLRRTKAPVPALLEPGLLEWFVTEAESHPYVADDLADLARKTPLLLGPSADFSRLRPLLLSRGLTVSPAGTDAFPLLLVRAERPDSAGQRTK